MKDLNKNNVDFINYAKQNNLIEDINIIIGFFNEVALRKNCEYKIRWLFDNKKNKDEKLTVLIDFYFPPMGFIAEEYKTSFKISLNCLGYAFGDMAYTLLFKLQEIIKKELSKLNKDFFNKTTKKALHPNAFALRDFIINLYDRTEPNFTDFTL